MESVVEDEEPAGARRGNALGDLQSSSDGNGEPEEHHVRAETLRAPDGAVEAACGGLEAAGRPEHQQQPLAHEAMVVDDQQAGLRVMSVVVCHRQRAYTRKVTEGCHTDRG